MEHIDAPVLPRSRRFLFMFQKLLIRKYRGGIEFEGAEKAHKTHRICLSKSDSKLQLYCKVHFAPIICTQNHELAYCMLVLLLI